MQLRLGALFEKKSEETHKNISYFGEIKQKFNS